MVKTVNHPRKQKPRADFMRCDKVENKMYLNNHWLGLVFQVKLFSVVSNTV